MSNTAGSGASAAKPVLQRRRTKLAVYGEIEEALAERWRFHAVLQ